MNKEEVQQILINKLNFSTEDVEKLQIFYDELLKFNKKYNLISKSTEGNVWSRHILDSAQIVKFIDFKQNNSLSDRGSGAGFPGIMLSLFNKNASFHVKLYEKSNIKCDFLDNIRNKLIFSIPVPNLFLMNSVNVSPLGNSFLIFGPKLYKNNIGAAVPKA